MATTTPTTIAHYRASTSSSLSIATHAFLAICWRYIFVTERQFPIFLAQLLLRPIFFLFIFRRILAETGYTGQVYSTLLLPSIGGTDHRHYWLAERHTAPCAGV